MTWFLSMVVVLPLMASAVPNQRVEMDAYNLHQALNYLNVYTSGKCDAAFALAQKHLSEVREEPSDKPFGDIVAAVRKLNNPSALDIFDLETLRMKFTDALDANHIAHQRAWHREIRSTCPTAPQVG